MRLPLRRTYAALVCLGALSMTGAFAQTFPSKPVRIIVPYEAAGVTDALARNVGQQLSDAVGQPVLIENRPGASTLIGMQACAKAPADGHTLCLAVAESMSYNPHVFSRLPYDPEADFAPVIELVRAHAMLVAGSAGPVTSFKEMIAVSRAKPGVVNWGTWGAASVSNVYLEWVKQQTKVNIVNVMYKGGAPIIPAMLAGDIHVTFATIGTVLPLIKSGKLRPIAVVGDKRSPLLPDVPSLAEEGADPGIRGFFGLFAPAKTPAPVVQRLNAELTRVMQTQRSQDFVRTWSLEATGGSPAEFAEFLKQDRAIAGRVFKAIGIRPGDAPS